MAKASGNLALRNAAPGLRAALRFEAEWEKGKYKYGDVVSKEWIETAMDLSDDGVATASETMMYRGQWMRAMADMRSYLLNKLKVLMVTSGDPAGYYLVRPEEQTAYAIDTFVRAVGRASKRSSEIAENTNTSGMSAEARRVASDQKALLRRMQTAAGGLMIQGNEATASISHLGAEE